MAAGLWSAVPGAAVLPPQQFSAARQPAESAAVVDVGLWPVAAVAAGITS